MAISANYIWSKTMQHLVISALASDRPGIVSQLAKTATNSGCSIMDSRMTNMGQEFAILMMVSGSEAAIERMETAIHELPQELEFQCILKRTKTESSSQGLLPYRATVIALDHPGIVHEIAGLFTSQSINIGNMDTETYAAPHTGTPMFALSMLLEVPSSNNVASLRAEFLEFCDTHNLDGSLEPISL